MRILNEQFSRLTREVGNVFLPILSKILPYLNAIVMVLTEIISIIARLFGYKKEDYDYFETMADDVYDFSDGVGVAASGVEKLKRGLRGFDKLNNITTPTATSGVGAGIGTGIDPDLMNAFNKAYDDYFKKISQVEMKATRIRDRIMEWLGFQKNIDEETNDVYFTFKKITGGTILGALGVGGSLYLGLKSIFNIFTKITGIKFTAITTFIKNLSKVPKLLTTINPKVAIIIGIVSALTAAFVKLYKENDTFREKVDKFVKMLKDDFLRVFNDIKDLLEPFLANIWDILKQIWNEVIKPLGNILLEILEPILETIVDILTAFWNNILRPMYPFLKWIVEIALKTISTTLQVIVTIIKGIVSVLELLWEYILKPLVNFVMEAIKNKIIPAIQSIGAVINTIKGAIQKVVDWWNNLSFNKKKISVEYETKGGGGEGSYGYGGGISGRAKGGIFVNGQWENIARYDGGGTPKTGQLFWARENGLAEMVGQIGSHTAVMNNDQIVSSVAYGVEGAVSRAMRNANQGKQIYNIYLDQDHKIGTYTLEQLQEMAKSNGKPLNIY